MLFGSVCLTCDANPLGLNLCVVKLSRAICASDVSQKQQSPEAGSVVLNLNILYSDVVDQKREMKWLVAIRKPCLIKVADARSSLLELQLAASRIAQRLDREVLWHASGL